MVSRPASTSRVTTALPSAISIFEAKVACGRSQSAASIWPVWLASSSMACLPRKIKSGIFLRASARNVCAAVSGSTAASRLHQDCPIRAHGQGGAQLLLRIGDADADGEDFGIATALLDAQRLFERDLIERIDAHFHAIQHDAAAVRFNPYAHVVIDDSLDTYHDLLH